MARSLKIGIKEVYLILLMVLVCNVNITQAACGTEVVYPLVYGTGTWDLILKSMEAF
jgi:hypothetical protein